MDSTLKLSILCALVGTTVSGALHTNVMDGITWVYSVDEYGGAYVRSVRLQDPEENHQMRIVKIPQVLGGWRVRHLGEKSFKNQEWIGELRIPEGIVSIEMQAFVSCHNLTNVVMSQSGKERGVSHILDDAFADCSVLRKVVLSDSVVTIGSGAFMDCVSLTDIELPPMLLFLGVEAFGRCWNLDCPRLPGMVELRGNPFPNCSHIEAFLLDDSNRQLCVRSGVLYDTHREVLVAYPAGLTNKTFSIPSGVKTLLATSFQGARHLEKVVVGSDVSVVGVQCFSSCPQLREIHFLGDKPEYDGEVFAPSNCVLYVVRRKGWKGVTTFYGNTVLDEPGQYGIDCWGILYLSVGMLGACVFAFVVMRTVRHKRMNDLR